MNDKDYYEILGLDCSASSEDIKRAYRKLAKQFHPDMNPDPDAAGRFAEIDVAHDVLIDPESRQEYDRRIGCESAENANSRSLADQDESQSTMEGRHGVPAPRLVEAQCACGIPDEGPGKARTSATSGYDGTVPPIPQRRRWRKPKRLTAFKTILIILVLTSLPCVIAAIFLDPVESVLVFFAMAMVAFPFICIVIRLAGFVE